ncbi:response regulator transcription factor [Fulvivirgaceae bacterium BMA12]|uniref:Response regulator transcription factor n=1 Tax=Agaribacillus aureus TaxID=3051825 RepID=A0ABT8KZJ4_9BACT|nr:response regulator transcription factor [Fulvivirgaceae bacterium BMA12]
MQAIRILLADDHKIIRDGIKALLKGAEGIEIVGDVEDGQQAINILEKEKIDLVLMDISMPVLNGIDATKYIRRNFPDVRVMALSMHDDDAHIINMLKAGAVGYVFKNTGKVNLVEAIKTVSSGESFFAKEASQKIMEYFMQNKDLSKKSGTTPDTMRLTEREKEVLKLIAEEYTNQEIAEKLFLSHRTIDTHRRNLLQKLSVKNTAGLVKYAIKCGLLDY